MRRGVRIGLATTGAMAVIGTGAAIAVPVVAAGGSGTTTVAGTTTGSTTTTATPNAQQFRRDREAQRTEYQKALAKELGVSVAELEKAEKAARQKVFLAHLDDMVAAGRITEAQADKLRAAAANGTLDAELKAQARARLKAALDGQVAAGLITQAQADAMLKRFDQNQDAHVPGLGGPGFGGRGGHHGGPPMGVPGYGGVTP